MMGTHGSAPHSRDGKEAQGSVRADGRATDELVEEAVAGYFAEVLQIRETLNGRYDDLKNGKVKPIAGDEVETHFRAKSDAARSKPGS
jgi:hypothetical protein